MPKGKSEREKNFSQNPPPCQRKGDRNSLNKNRAIFCGFSRSWSASKVFSKPTVLLNVPGRLLHIFHQIPHLAIKQGANGINRFP